MSQANSSSWTSFLKSIASYNGDLSSLTAPPFILSPTSLVEYSKYWAEYPHLLINPNTITNDDEDTIEQAQTKRVLGVTKYFISTLKSQYCSRNESMGSEKKPLNPFLGELFVGHWDDQSIGETILLSEQVSHHPPITAYAISNKQQGVSIQGYSGIKSSISATNCNVKQYGHAILKYDSIGEEYLLTVPPLHIEGLLVASPFVELQDNSYIVGSNGFIVVIEYSGRGYFSGKKNTFKARIYKDSASSTKKENALYTIFGQWSGISHINKGSSSTYHSSTSEIFYDANSQLKNELIVKPIEEQNELESRRAWSKVSDAIKEGNYDLIHKEKTLIENHQRQLRNMEIESGTNWETRWFKPVDYSNGVKDIFTMLCDLGNLSSGNVPSGTIRNSIKDLDKGLIHWRFDHEKWENENEIVV